MHIGYIYYTIQEDLQKMLNKKLGAEGINNRSVFFFTKISLKRRLTF